MGRLICGRIASVMVLFFLFAACAGAPIQSAKTKGVYHRVKRGQTLGTIARAYHVTVLDIAVANSIEDPDYIEADRVVFIPGATRVVEDVGTVRGEDAAATVVPPTEQGKHEKPSVVVKPAEPDDSGGPPQVSARTEVSPRPGGEKVAEAKDKRSLRAEVAAVHQETAAKQRAPDIEEKKQRFIWPVKGKVMSRFGRQPDGMYYNGIDIAARDGEPIVAAASGKVTFSAHLRDYGETIIIQHDDHFSTVYTHLGRRIVKQQDQIRKGDQIARLGKPDKRSDACLNFGIWYKNIARDPLFFLP